MDKTEAQSVLNNELARYRRLSYAELLRLLGQSDNFDCAARSGKTYQVEVEAVWDSKPNESLRVLAMIDDGSWMRSFVPLCEDFIMRPDGSFVGE
ncbi:MAG: hypothetical protein H0W34_07750 [Pyrinomonadaceae bacterium]|nr:hypothetical protein [Pyrinomonadaceae bacterium]